MPARHAVLLTAQGSDPRLLPTIILESTLIGTLQVFILDNLKPLRINKTTKSPHFAQFWCNISSFRINTSKSVSKQTTLTPFRINTYEKQGEGGGSPQTINSLLCQKAILNPLSFHFAPQQILDVAHLFPKQIQLPRQALNFGLGAPVNGVIQFAAHAIFPVLPVLAHHNDRSLDGCEQGQNQIQQNKRIRIPGYFAQDYIERGIDAADHQKANDEGPGSSNLNHGVGDPFGDCLLLLDHVVRVAHRTQPHQLLRRVKLLPH